jgi:hypothetical protein
VSSRKTDGTNRSTDKAQDGTSLHRRGLLGQELGHNPEVGSASPETSDSPNSQEVSMHDLSFIIHPSHEPTSKKNSSDDHAYMSTPESSSGADEPFMLTLACNALDISLEKMNVLYVGFFSTKFRIDPANNLNCLH